MATNVKSKSNKSKSKSKSKGSKKQGPTGAEAVETVVAVRSRFQVAVKTHKIPRNYATAFLGLLDQAEEDQTVLQKVVLVDVSCGAAYATALMETLRDYEWLRCLRLWRCGVGCNEGIATMAPLLRSPSLTTLDLIDCGLTASGCEVLARVFKTNPSLQTVCLDHNLVGDAGASALSHGIRGRSIPLDLSLQYCRIGSEGAILLAQVTTGLQGLNLKGNDLGKEGIDALATALRSNTTMCTLGLADTGLATDPMSLDVLCEAIEGNTTLEELDVSLNPISSEGGRMLLEVAIMCAHLRLLHVTEQIDTDVFRAICELNASRTVKKAKKRGKKKK